MSKSGFLRTFCVLIVALLVCVVLPSASQAEYRYIGQEPRVVHSRLVKDMLVDKLDLTNLAPSALTSLRATYAPSLYAVGPLKSVCLTVIIASPQNRTFAFTSHHDKGLLDWVVTANLKTNLIEYLIFFSRDKGPPGILPPFNPQQSQSMIAPTDLGCYDPSNPLSGPDLERACARWPELCARPNAR